MKLHTFAPDGKRIYSVDMAIAFCKLHKPDPVDVELRVFQDSLERKVWGDLSPLQVVRAIKSGKSLQGMEDDATRIHSAQLKFPLLITMIRGSPVIVDGYHRAAKAILQNRTYIPCIILSADVLRKCLLDSTGNFVRVHQQLQTWQVLELFAKRFT